MSVAAPFDPQTLETSLRELVPDYPNTRLCVAVSGGVDSMALLHAAQTLASAEPRVRLRAIHVDHGLQRDSRQWAAACRTQCGTLGVSLQVLELRLQIAKGESVEAEARRARYAAIASALEPGECLLTAHHADDQLETVLLQLFRGAGVAGLAAMPRAATLGKGLHLRPLLGVERVQLDAYASTIGLTWVEDPMNRESRYDRAYLRHEVLPAIRRRWPAAARTVGRSAGHFAAARGLLESLAEGDGVQLVDDSGRLEIAALVALPRERQVNVLRWWIVRQGLGVPSAARLESILRDVAAARGDAQPLVTWPTGEVRRHRGRLHAMQPLGPLPPSTWRQDVGLGGTVELPCGLGRLTLALTRGEGLPVTALQRRLTLGFLGSPAAEEAGPKHGLREVLRLAKVLPWMRERVPITSDGNQVLGVAGHWIRRYPSPAAGEPTVRIVWQGGPPCI